jgi:hypothetical protein
VSWTGGCRRQKHDRRAILKEAGLQTPAMRSGRTKRRQGKQVGNAKGERVSFGVLPQTVRTARGLDTGYEGGGCCMPRTGPGGADMGSMGIIIGEQKQTRDSRSDQLGAGSACCAGAALMTLAGDGPSMDYL